MKDWEAWYFSFKMDYHYISNAIAQQERQRKFWVLAKESGVFSGKRGWVWL